MTYITSHPMERERPEVPAQETCIFNSFLLKREIIIHEIDTLSDQDLHLLIAETKSVTSPLYIGGSHKKLMASYCYEYANLIFQKRLKTD